MLTLDEVGYILQRTRTIQGVHRNEVVELIGLQLAQVFCIPALSNWNVPLVSPRWYSSYVSGHPAECIYIYSNAIVALDQRQCIFDDGKGFKPKKSILITPAFSMMLPSNCVISRFTSFTAQTGISSVRSLGAMMIPAAWIPVLRTEPSSFSASRSTCPVHVIAVYLAQLVHVLYLLSSQPFFLLQALVAFYGRM
jgi:hypothetical protein